MEIDALSEILLKVDPSNIVKFLLTSQEWLQAIKDPFFRQEYMKKWKSDELVGFLVADQKLLLAPRLPEQYPLPPAVQLLPTSQMGCVMNQNNLMPSGAGYFISKSDNGLILSGIHPKIYYVFNPLKKQVDRLPRPPKYCPRVAIAVMSSSDDDGNIGKRGYKVIQAKVEEKKSLFVQTYSSSTGTWEKSKAACSTKFWLWKDDVGTVTRAGVVYWRAYTHHPVQCLAAYDTNTARITLLKMPNSFFHFPQLDQQPNFDPDESDWGIDFGSSFYCESPVGFSESPEGFLRCATCCSTVFNIWVLDHRDYEHEPDFDAVLNDGDDAGWSLKYKIDLEAMWLNNSGSLGLKCKRPFLFVSFVDGKWDSIYVRMKAQFLEYDLESGKLERVPYYEDAGGYKLPNNYGFESLSFRPLTMTELGAWPW